MHPSRQYVTEGFFVALAPIVGFFALRISLINQDGGLDAWLYTGYGQEFKTLQELFGWTYYAVRFPVILLDLAVPKTLDPVAGFAMVRYVVFLSCSIPLYLWARLNFGVIYAIVAILFLICNPLFPRLLLMDWTVFVSVPMAVAGIALWQLSNKPNAIVRGLSGFAFCASVASHAFTGTAIASFFLVEASRRLIKRQYSDLFWLDVASPVVGAALCFAIGMAFYFSIIGPFDPRVIVTVTLSAIGAGDQYSAAHHLELGQWIWSSTNTLVPAIMLSFVVIGFSRELFKDTVVARVAWFALVYCSAYASYEFLFHRFVLENYFYFFHLTIVCYLLFPICLYLITRNLTSINRVVVVGLTITALIATPLLKNHFTIAPEALEAIVTRSSSFAIAGIITILVAIRRASVAARSVAGAAAYAVALVLLVQFAGLSAPDFGAIYANPRQAREFDVYRAGVETVRLFARFATPSQKLML